MRVKGPPYQALPEDNRQRTLGAAAAPGCAFLRPNRENDILYVRW